VKLARIWSWTCRLDALSGRTRSSGRPNSARRKGVPRNSSTATTEMAIGQGRRMTKVAMRCHDPSPISFGLCRSSVHRSTLGPIAARSDGRNTSAPKHARATTAIPA
jgi:hypothetical protein